MFDRLMRATFRNFSTLFLLAFMILGPLHLLYAFTFRNVIATQELHPAIRTFPNYRQVRSVGPPTLQRAAIAFWLLAGVEVALIPLGVAATRRVLSVEASGGVPTATDAWKHVRGRDRARGRVGGEGVTGGGNPTELIRSRSRRSPWGPVVAGAAVGAAAGLLTEIGANHLAELAPEDLRWILVGAGQATSRSLGAPFVLVPLAAALAAKAHPGRAPKLY